MYVILQASVSAVGQDSLNSNEGGSSTMVIINYLALLLLQNHARRPLSWWSFFNVFCCSYWTLGQRLSCCFAVEQGSINANESGSSITVNVNRVAIIGRGASRTFQACRACRAAERDARAERQGLAHRARCARRAGCAYRAKCAIQSRVTIQMRRTRRAPVKRASWVA